MENKNFAKAFLAGFFSIGLSPVPQEIPCVPELDERPVWDGVRDCFADAGMRMADARTELAPDA
jgi:hypothetical protein